MSELTRQLVGEHEGGLGGVDEAALDEEFGEVLVRGGSGLIAEVLFMVGRIEVEGGEVSGLCEVSQGLEREAELDLVVPQAEAVHIAGQA